MSNEGRHRRVGYARAATFHGESDDPQDAGKIIKTLLEKADKGLSRGLNVGHKLKQWLKMHRVSDARAALIDAMRENRLFTDMPSEEIYSFSPDDKDGDRKDSRFKIWKIQDGKFTDQPDLDTEPGKDHVTLTAPNDAP